MNLNERRIKNCSSCKFALKEKRRFARVQFQETLCFLVLSLNSGLCQKTRLTRWWPLQLTFVGIDEIK